MADEYAWDFSIVPGPDPAVLVRVDGTKGMLGYSFGARQSDAYLDDCRGRGLTVVWIWERNTDSIFTADGAAECRAHEARTKPGELTYVACDTNDGGVAGRDLSPFLRAWQATTREAEFGLYGSSGAIRQGMAFGGKLTRFWGVVNWINGGKPDNHPDNIAYWRDAGAHLIQLVGEFEIPSADKNLILRPEWGTIGDNDMTPDELLTTLFAPGPFGISQFEAAMLKYHDGAVAPVHGIDGKPAKLIDWIGLVDYVNNVKAQKALTDAIAAAIASVHGGGNVDPKALADAILAELSAKLAVPTTPTV